MLTIAYPGESFFYPYHIIAAVIAGSIFGVIVSVLYFMRERRKKRAGGETKTADWISLATLVVTLAVSGVYPFLINPMLDYTVAQEDPNANRYMIDVTNWGLSPAKNVIFSLMSRNVTFSDFSTEPFLGNYSKSNTSLEGTALSSIAVLPPRSHTIIHFKVDTSKVKTNQKLTSFVRSDERVGYHDVVLTIFFYVILAIVIAFMFIWLIFIENKITKWPVIISLVAVFGWMFLFSAFYYMHALNTWVNSISD